MRKMIFAVAAAGALMAPAFAEPKIQNRVECEKVQEGATIHLHETGHIDAKVVNVSGGLVWLETTDKQSLIVPINQPMWVGEKMATSGDINNGADVTVVFPEDRELRVKKIDGEKAWLGTYDGVISLPITLMDKMDAAYYLYTDETKAEN